MGVYTRPNSPYYWVHLPRPGQKPLQLSTKILIAGVTPEIEKDNAALAQAAYQTMMGDLARERFELPSARTTPTIAFTQYADWYETHHTPRHRGAERERWLLARLRVGFGRLLLQEITRARCQEYITTRMERDGVKAGTVKRELSLLKTMLNLAVGEHIEYNPLLGMKLPRVVKVPKRTMTRAEERLFLAALDDEEIRDLYLVGVGTLLRQENLLSLQRRHYLGTHVQLTDSKTGPYVVPLTGPTALQRRAAKVLARRRPTTPQGYFFPKWQARFAAEKVRASARMPFLRAVRRAVETAGVPWGLDHGGVVWHTLTRATGATRMLREHHIDIRTVQLIGNWKSLDQMADYLGIDLELLGRAATGTNGHGRV